ncbi:TPA: glycosyltransferase family 2 protein [Aeromonas veronii]
MRAKFDMESTDNHFERYTNVRSKLIFDTCPNLKPTISIMIPTFKRCHLIKDAIDSSFNQNTNVTFEVVVVDNDADCEFENELKALISTYSNFNIRYFRNEENIGMFGNWNRCIELARAEYLTILNDDDLLDCDWMSYMTSNIEGVTLLGCCANKFSTISELKHFKIKEINKFAFKIWSVRDLFIGMWTNGSLGTLLNKRTCIELGGFDEQKYPMADWYFITSYVCKYKAKVSNNKLAFFRWGENESMKLSVLKAQIKSNFEFRGYLIKKKYVNGFIWTFLADIIRSKTMKYAAKEHPNYDYSYEVSENKMNLLYMTLLSYIPLGRIISMYYFMKYKLIRANERFCCLNLWS